MNPIISLSNLLEDYNAALLIVDFLPIISLSNLLEDYNPLFRTRIADFDYITIEFIRGL